MLKANVHHPQRTAILDKLRACAILSVMVYHVVQMSPAPLPHLARITWYGQYGVDLFFVLSGWLIGGLYWREANEFGSVDTLRFWSRRWMRTLPPYFVALMLSWLAVDWARGEPFDRHYLLFLQNYYERIPFFLVSWSLCIEEHFYLAAPIIAGMLLISVPRRLLWLPWVVFISISPFFRWFESRGAGAGEFGYFTTATHLRLDGLVLGGGLSYVALFAPIVFKALARQSLFVIPASIAGLAALETIGGLWQIVFWPTVIALLCAGLVVIGVSYEDRQKHAVAQRSIVPWATVAITSYSAYLLHPLSIHIARKVVFLIGTHSWLLYWPAVVVVIFIATGVFYVVVERSSIRLRDAWVPSRPPVSRSGLKAH